MFPSSLRQVSKMVVTQQVATASGNTIAFKGNSFYNTGPALNNSGSYATNVPSGLFILLGTEGASGSKSIYNTSRIFASSIEAQVLPYGGTGGSSGGSSTSNNSAPARLICFPTTSASTAAMSSSVMMEQPYAKQWMLPATETCAQLKFKHYMSTKVMYGVPHSAVATAPQYAAITSSGTLNDPVNLWYWQLYLIPLDGTTWTNYWITFTLTFYYRCEDINSLLSTVPS